MCWRRRRFASEGTARVIAVGDDTCWARLAVLKRYKPELTPLQLATWRTYF